MLFEKFALPDALAGYRRHGVTVAGGSTAFYSMFLAEQRKDPGTPLIPTLRLLAGGGAPKPPELYHAVVRELGCQLTHGYGMTEVPMITMGSPDDTPENLATTEGRPAGHVHPHHHPRRRPAARRHGRRGAAARRGRLPGLPEPRGHRRRCLRRRRLPDHRRPRPPHRGRPPRPHGPQQGRDHPQGENISAKEIEDLLHRLPAVGDVAVIGLPDPERGERVCAVVEQPAGAAPLTLAQVTAYLRAEGLSPHKLPEQLELVEALPRNDTLRKVLKYRLRERYSRP